MNSEHDEKKIARHTIETQAHFTYFVLLTNSLSHSSFCAMFAQNRTEKWQQISTNTRPVERDARTQTHEKKEFNHGHTSLKNGSPINCICILNKSTLNKQPEKHFLDCLIDNL